MPAEGENLFGVPEFEVKTKAVAEVVPINGVQLRNRPQPRQIILGLDGPEIHVFAQSEIYTAAGGHREPGCGSCKLEMGSVRDNHASQRGNNSNVGNGKALPGRSAAEQSLDIGLESAMRAPPDPRSKQVVRHGHIESAAAESRRKEDAVVEIANAGAVNGAGIENQTEPPVESITELGAAAVGVKRREVFVKRRRNEITSFKPRIGVTQEGFIFCIISGIRREAED